MTTDVTVTERAALRIGEILRLEPAATMGGHCGTSGERSPLVCRTGGNQKSPQPYPISITGSRPIRRDSARRRLKTRSPPSAANSSGRRSANR